METNVILESAIRYLHAMHDIELPVGDDNLADALHEKVVALNDPQLIDYWDQFVLSTQKTVDNEQVIADLNDTQKTDKVAFHRGFAA